MLNRSASLAMSTRVLKALPGKLKVKRHSPSILYVVFQVALLYLVDWAEAGFSNIPFEKWRRNCVQLSS